MALLKGQEAADFLKNNPGKGQIISGDVGQMMGGNTRQPSKAMDLLRAIGSSGQSNPTMDNFAMNLLMQEMEQPDPEQQIREALVSRMLDSDTPDYNKVYQLWGGGDIGTILSSMQQQ